MEGRPVVPGGPIQVVARKSVKERAVVKSALVVPWHGQVDPVLAQEGAMRDAGSPIGEGCPRSAKATPSGRYITRGWSFGPCLAMILFLISEMPRTYEKVLL